MSYLKLWRSVMNIVVIDKEKGAKFYKNSGEYRLTHPERSLALDPGHLYKLTPDTWISGQPTLVETDENGEVVEAPASTDKPKAAAQA